MTRPDRVWELHSAQAAHEGYTISVRVNSRIGLLAWLVEVHVTLDGRIVANQLRASAHANAGEAIAFGVAVGRGLIESLDTRDSAPFSS